MTPKQANPANIGIRKRRAEQVLRPGGNYGYQVGLLQEGLLGSARRLLLLALDEARPNSGENHLTTHGPGAIVLAAAAFEAFLNEALHVALGTLREPADRFEALVKRDDLLEKYRELPKLVGGGREVRAATVADLELVGHVRNEIVHHYVRHVRTADNVPEWLQPLASMNLLVSYKKSPSDKDIGWDQKLTSYLLAKWCAETVAACAQEFAAAITAGERRRMVASMVTTLAGDFRVLLIRPMARRLQP
jgi:hypothetical protein